MDYLTNAKPSIRGMEGVNPSRERDPNCIESVLKQIEVELSESANSATNAADKLNCDRNVKAGLDHPMAPEPGSPDVLYRLNRILNTVRQINQELGRSHSAISG